MSDAHTAADRVARFEELLVAIEATEDVAELAALQEQAYAAALHCLQVDGTLPTLHALAPRFDEAGLFLGSDWQRPDKLQADLVETTLQTPEGVGIECVSQLRLLAVALGDHAHPRISADEARRFLERVLALNLGSLFPEAPEELPAPSGDLLSPPTQRLLAYVLDALGVDGVTAHLVLEAERILLTRPIQVERVRRMIDSAARSVAAWGASEVAREAALLVDALHGPTPLSRVCDSLEEYETALAALDEPGQLLEADTMSTSMRRTGLVCPQHAVLVRHASQTSRRLLCRALGLEDVGRCTLAAHELLVHALIDAAVGPATAQSVYGLAQLLDRGVPFQAAVPAGLRQLLTLTIAPAVAEEIVAGSDAADPPPARTLLLAGILSVLGTPRGVDQGHNPTCQSARAISLWAQIDPGYLLRLVAHAARDDALVMYFEGAPIRSTDVERGVADELHTELDAVSLLLTPHLDRIYWEMSRRALDRAEDEHKWVNPEFHGWWVHRGFAALIDELSGAIHRAERFVRLFFATYHPLFNGGRTLLIPQPCGIATTNQLGNFLDWHAVSIQRVEDDPQGVPRVYFFNPNHDKGQDWGQGVVTSTSDRGELMGESSLPFHQFASRLYVFHYDPAEVGPLAEVPDDAVAEVLDRMRQSWARSFDEEREG